MNQPLGMGLTRGHALTNLHRTQELGPGGEIVGGGVEEGSSVCRCSCPELG